MISKLTLIEETQSLDSGVVIASLWISGLGSAIWPGPIPKMWIRNLPFYQLLLWIFRDVTACGATAGFFKEAFGRPTSLELKRCKRASRTLFSRNTTSLRRSEVGYPNVKQEEERNLGDEWQVVAWQDFRPY